MKVFVIAMESEAKPLIENMQSVERREVHARNVYTGTLCGERIAAVVCGVGKVNAAAGAQYAIDVLEADTIINIGVAGGLNDGTKVGEIYAISHAVQYDFDLAQLNGTSIGTLNEYEEPYLPLCISDAYPLKKLASGDRFNDDKYDFRLLTAVVRADIRDMEGGAIAQVCRHANVPFYSFKAISDVAGKGSTTEQFKKNLDECANKMRANISTIFEAIK